MLSTKHRELRSLLSLQVLYLSMVKRWPTSCLPSLLALLWPLTWKWWTCFPLATITWVRGATSSWGWPLAQGTGRWFLIGWWTRQLTPSISAVLSYTPAGKCLCFRLHFKRVDPAISWSLGVLHPGYFTSSFSFAPFPLTTQASTERPQSRKKKKKQTRKVCHFSQEFYQCDTPDWTMLNWTTVNWPHQVTAAVDETKTFIVRNISLLLKKHFYWRTGVILTNSLILCQQWPILFGRTSKVVRLQRECFCRSRIY